MSGRIFLTGDLHGTIDVHKLSSSTFTIGTKLKRDDYVIILGDFGFLWTPYPSKEEIWWLKWFDEIKTWTTLVVDGNHDNQERYSLLPTVEMFGSEVGYISDSIFHLRRGHIYNIPDLDSEYSFFVMGGATSIDKEQRIEGISWWPAEVPCYAEFELGLQNLEKHNWKVDYILSHTGPQYVIDEYLESMQQSLSKVGRCNDPVQQYLNNVHEYTTFKRHFFGHMHPDKTWVSSDGKSVCIYNDIIRLIEEK